VDRRVRPSLIVLLALLATILYIGSAVPAVWLAKEGYLPAWATVIYIPVFAVPPLREFVRWSLDNLP